MMKSKYRYLLLVVGILSFASCEYDIIEPISYTIINDDTLSFQDDIVPILDNYCIECHDAVHSLPLVSPNAYHELNDTLYINRTEPENSLLYTILVSGHYDDASSEDYNTILVWISEGAENN